MSEKKTGWHIAAAVLDLVEGNVQRNVILDHIDRLEAEGVTPEQMPARIRAIRVNEDAATQAAIDAKRGQQESG